ncbi:MAG: hypothetical protein IPM32_00640 [Ignavibacteriae bacterium]|nr:hypothetical protein [Ignavibacteriota bacterium]
MKKILFIILIFTINIFGQSESQVGWIAKFGGAGGFTPMLYFPNYDEVNIQIDKLGMEKLSGPLYAWGGSGYAYVTIIDNLRLGGIGFSGYQSENSDVNNFKNEIEYSLGGGAATIEYTMPFVKNIAVSVGIMFGGGSLEIDFYKNLEENNWDEIWNNVNANDQNRNYQITNSFWLLSPTLNADIPITRFLAVRAGLGYQFTFGNNWEIANQQKINNVPSDLNGNSFFIQTGIFIGLFAF